MRFDDLKNYWAIVQEKVEFQKKQIAIRKKAKIREVEEALLPPLGAAPYEYRKAYEFVSRPPADYKEAPRRQPLDYDRPYGSLEEYARGVRLLELEWIRQLSCHRQQEYAPTARADFRASREDFEDDEVKECAMSAIVYGCPTTGQNVQPWVDDEKPADDPTTYVSVKCPACARVHLVNPSTQKTPASGAYDRRPAVAQAADYRANRPWRGDGGGRLSRRNPLASHTAKPMRWVWGLHPGRVRNSVSLYRFGVLPL